ncbi:MAG: heme-dependent oxidative N-demethylase subunit alpha family protein, partial [Rhizobiaceae bacterium]
MTRQKQPVHTPYDGSSKPFSIGLKALDDSRFIEVDDNLLAYLDEKDRLAATIPRDVIVAEPGSEAAQDEVLARVAAKACADYPSVYRRDASIVAINGGR